MPDTPVNEVETTKDFGPNPAGIVSRWCAEFRAYDKVFKPWRTTTRRIVKRYRDEEDSALVEERGGATSRKFNILWSNISTLQPALYSRTPVPEISRRWKDRNPAARAAAEILERSTAYAVDTMDFDGVMKAARDDFLFSGRGQAWVRYEPTLDEPTRDRVALDMPCEGEPFRDAQGNIVDPQIDENGQPFLEGDEFRPVLAEDLALDYVNWDDFGHVVAPTWDRVPAVWRRSHLKKAELVAEFGAVGGKVPLKFRRKELEDDREAKKQSIFKTGEVFEVWDKESRKVYWIAPDFKERPLRVVDDPLGLESFFPCPKPIYGTMTTDSLVPVPDYTQYEAQADELDELTERIALLTEALRVAGVYNGAHGSLERLLSADAENIMIGVDGWAMFAEKGGVAGAVDWFPVEQVAKVLAGLIEARERIKQDLFEISGISDIIRGDVDPREKLGQSQIKRQSASNRLREPRDAVANFARDLVRIMAEIIAEQFDPETLLEISGWDATANAQAADEAERAQLFQEAVALLKDEKLRGFRIEIETDSTIFEDRQAEQQERTEFLAALTPFLERAIPAMEAQPALKPLFSEIIRFGVRSFRVGRHIEDVLDEALDAMAQQKPQQQGPDPVEMEKIALERETMQADNQRAMVELANTKEIELIKAQAELAKAQKPENTIGLSAEAEAQIGPALTQMVAQQTETLAAALTAVQQTQQMVAAVLQQVSSPRETVLVRDEAGRPTGAVSRPAAARLN